MKYRGADPHEDAIFKELIFELNDAFRVGVLELSLDQLTILSDEVKGSKETSNTPLSETVVLQKHLFHSLCKNLLHLLNVSDDILVNHVLHGLIPSNAADWMSLVGSSPSKRCSSEVVLNVLSETNG